MVLARRERSSTHMRGTIIDLETIGPFDRTYPPWDPRHYASVSPTIFGYLTGDTLIQHCAENTEEIQEIIETMRDTLPGLEQPFYALNCGFERNIIANTCRQDHPFRDVRGGRHRGSKWAIRQRLGIPAYGDPFHGDGLRCIPEWHNGNHRDCLRHNRACLLIERDIHRHIRTSQRSRLHPKTPRP